MNTNPNTTIVRTATATGDTAADFNTMLDIHRELSADGIDYDWSTADATIDGVASIVFATGPINTTF
jgi:hypothetical protein